MAKPSKSPALPNRNSTFHPFKNRNIQQHQTPGIMNTAILAQLDFIPKGFGTVVVAVVGILIVVFLFMAIWASRYTKVGPNQVLVFSGRKRKYIEPDGSVVTRGFRIVKGGGTFV